MRHSRWIATALITGAAIGVFGGPPLAAQAEQLASHVGAESPDTRATVPLPPMMAQHQKEDMRAHLAAIQQIVAALSRDDFDLIAAAAGRIGYSDTMAQMCAHMQSPPRWARCALP